MGHPVPPTGPYGAPGSQSKGEVPEPALFVECFAGEGPLSQAVAAYDVEVVTDEVTKGGADFTDPEAVNGIKELLEGLAGGAWMSDGALLSRPEDWQPLREGKGSYKFGRTMLFLAAGRLGQLQLLRTVRR